MLGHLRAVRQQMPFIKDIGALRAGNDEPIVAARLVGHLRVGIEILHDEVAILRDIKVERIVGGRHNEIGPVRGFKCAPVVLSGGGCGLNESG